MRKHPPFDALFLVGRTLPVTQPEASMMSISPLYGHGPPRQTSINGAEAKVGTGPGLQNSETLQEQMDVFQQQLR